MPRYPRNEKGQFIKGYKNPNKLSKNDFVCSLCGTKFRRRGTKKNIQFCSPKCRISGRNTTYIYQEVNGYLNIYKPDHPRSSKAGYVKGHILIAEKILGKFLPEGVVVHHHDKNPSNNDPSNLIICEDQTYHQLLHKRMRAYESCGHSNWEFCRHCKIYEPKENLEFYPSRPKIFFHRECQREYDRRMYDTLL